MNDWAKSIVATLSSGEHANTEFHTALNILSAAADAFKVGIKHQIGKDWKAAGWAPDFNSSADASRVQAIETAVTWRIEDANNLRTSDAGVRCTLQVTSASGRVTHTGGLTVELPLKGWPVVVSFLDRTRNCKTADELRDQLLAFARDPVFQIRLLGLGRV